MSEDKNYARDLYIEEIARLISEGLDVENIAIKTNLTVPFVHKVMSDEKFDETFKAIDPDAFETWKEAKGADAARRRVKEMAQADAVDHYKLLRDIVRDPENSLDDKDRANYLERLIKMSGAVDKEIQTEVVSLNPAQLENINEAWKESHE